MDYISVKEAADRFGISERRVQKLCELQRIEGIRMVSGVWLIPYNAEKPEDERKTMEIVDEDFISLRQLCEELSISLATGKNWIKLGKIKPQCTKKNILFTKEYVDKVKQDIKSGVNTSLKSRRNKKYVSGNALYNAYVGESSVNVEVIRKLLDEVFSREISLENKDLQLLLAECAIQMIIEASAEKESKEHHLLRYLKGEIVLSKYKSLVDDLIIDKEYAKEFIEKYPSLFAIKYTYEPREDILGLLYISFKNIANRKAMGAYYTPTKVVKHLIKKICLEKNDLADKRILDPCCGTGNFLLQLPDGFDISNVYGNDIDSLSVKLTRINLALKYQPEDSLILYKNITNLNYLCQFQEAGFDYIVGNPPWGYNFSEEEKMYLRKNYNSAEGKNIESYDVFIERALLQLKKNGMLSYVLPEAIMNVKAHMPIRREIINKNSIKYLAHLGNAFDKVQCPCIIMQLQHTEKPIDCVGMIVNDGKREYQIEKQRKVDSEYFSFSTTDEEQAVIDKITNCIDCVYLENNAIFALGIVTGNNKDYISTVKSEENEKILKGADIYKFKTLDTHNYIVFEPESFQQIAPIEYYRAPEKLLYRFICNQLVFAYDDKQTLSLNSCNIVIPQIEGLTVKYIMTVLNSRVAQFVFKKRFNSIKILKSHIERIPLPRVEKAKQREFENYADKLMMNYKESELLETYNELDKKIAEQLFGLNKEEYGVILNSLEGENMFLH